MKERVRAIPPKRMAWCLSHQESAGDCDPRDGNQKILVVYKPLCIIAWGSPRSHR